MTATAPIDPWDCAKGMHEPGPGPGACCLRCGCVLDARQREAEPSKSSLTLGDLAILVGVGWGFGFGQSGGVVEVLIDAQGSMGQRVKLKVMGSDLTEALRRGIVSAKVALDVLKVVELPNCTCPDRAKIEALIASGDVEVAEDCFDVDEKCPLHSKGGEDPEGVARPR